MKVAADAEKFRTFAEAHRKDIYQKMLARMRRRCGDLHWAPTGMLSAGGLWFAARVDEQIANEPNGVRRKPQQPLTVRSGPDSSASPNIGVNLR
jgi:hypothetical protein